MLATPPKPRRVELILRQIDSLPTLPAVATRLLQLTSSDDSDARDVMELIASDPPLTAKVLSLCRTADKGLREDVITVDRAVVLLGFSAIRNAVLSVKVFELFEEGHGATKRRSHEGEDDADLSAAPSLPRSAASTFDRPGFWRHCLSVAILAEQMLANGPRSPGLDPGEAFVCGLLHDIGKLALDHVLPKSFARVLELVDLNQGNIAEFEQRIIGIDHHTAGKRLAEQWGLPHRLQDCIWLHGTPYETLPKLDHQRLIGVVSLADLLARQLHTGYSGNHRTAADAGELAARIGIAPAAVEQAVESLHDELERRSRALGLDTTPSQQLFLESIGRANDALGRLNASLERRSRTAQQQARVLEGISAFHAGTTPGQRVQDVLDAVANSARQVFGAGLYTLLHPIDRDDEEAGATIEGGAWLIAQYNAEGRPVHSQIVEAPPTLPDLRRLDTAYASGGLSLDLMSVLPWVADYLVESADVRRVRLLPLTCGWGAAALMLHDRDTLPAWSILQPLVSTWGAAIAAAGQHDGARRLGEELAQANTALADAQDRLLRQESMARLGEMASGAAHEMNNPLAVISGRSQLLASSLKAGSKEQKAAQLIEQESHRLSDLISCLRMYADPPRAQRQLVDIGQLLDETVKQVMASELRDTDTKSFSLQIKKPADRTLIALDPEMVRRAVAELLLNAVQARPRSSVLVTAQVQELRQNLVVTVTDDGDGMDAHTLAHAMDPFFSAKPAGRRVGMGLPRAQLLAAAHGGEVGLRSLPGKGTTATLSLPLDSSR